VTAAVPQESLNASFADRVLMARDLGKIHGKYWNDEETLSKKYLAPEGYLNTPPVPIAWAMGFDEAWPKWKPQWKKVLTDQGHDAGDLSKFPKADAVFCKMAEDSARVRDTLVAHWKAKPYRTLCHGDARSDNLFEKPDGSGLIWIDWQLVYTCSSIGLDLGWGVWGCCEADVRRREKEIIHEYYESLCAAHPAAAEQVTEEDIFHDYKLGLILWSMALM